MAGAVDLSFSTTACLEASGAAPARSRGCSGIFGIAVLLARLPSANYRDAQVFKLDFASQKRELPLAGGAVAASERFHRLAWSPPGSETDALPVRAPNLCNRLTRAGD